MLNNSNVNLNFNLREPKKNGTTNIYAVIRIDGKQIKIPTGLKITPWQWDKRKQIPIINNNMSLEDIENAKCIFNKIYEIRLLFQEKFLYVCNNENVQIFINNLKLSTMRNMNSNSLANLQKGKGRAPKATTLANKAFNIYYQMHTNVKESSIMTAKEYLKSYIRYCEAIGKDALSMLSQTGINAYQDYLMSKSIKDRENGKKRYDSTKNINTKCELIERLINKVMVGHNDFLKYKISTVKYIQLEEVKQKGDEKKRRPLKDEEIAKLRECQGLTEEEREYRDLFLLECNGSYRVSDTAKLFSKEQQQTYKRDMYEFIVINTQKEGIISVIWINDTIRDILKRYADGFKYAAPSDQKKYAAKYNKMIKKIAEKAGLDSMERWKDAHGVINTKPLYEIIGSHFARYTFIYNGLFKIGFTAEELKDFTGHCDDRMINECYKLETAEDKVNNALKAIKRVTEKEDIHRERITRHNLNEQSDLITEVKDALCFLGANYLDIESINDYHTLSEILYLDYHNKYMEMGCDMQYIKDLYLNREMSLRERREKLRKVIDEVKSKRITFS